MAPSEIAVCPAYGGAIMHARLQRLLDCVSIVVVACCLLRLT